MDTFKMLILTDHRTHSAKNSVYKLAAALRKHPRCGSICVASRSNPENHSFFYENRSIALACHEIGKRFSFTSAKDQLMEQTRKHHVDDFHVILLRLPRPIPDGFFEFLESVFPKERIINRPSGIRVTGSKEFLLQFQDICPPMQLCRNMDDIIKFQKQFPIVLKPIENYGGKGVVKVENQVVFTEKKEILLSAYRPILEEQFAIGGYLAMKFLKNVDQGDKRIVVVNGQILGAALRLPPKGSWICNAAMGGSSNFSKADEKEKEMAALIHKKVASYGIAMFGMDTLVGDDGIRKLSEINTLSIGGIAPMAKASGEPLVEKAADLLWDYIISQWK